MNPGEPDFYEDHQRKEWKAKAQANAAFSANVLLASALLLAEWLGAPLWATAVWLVETYNVAGVFAILAVLLPVHRLLAWGSSDPSDCH